MRVYLGVAFWIIVTGAWMVGFWAITSAMKKAREAGYRYWLINPFVIVHMFRSKEFAVFLLAGVVVAASVSAAFVFFSQLGPSIGA